MIIWVLCGVLVFAFARSSYYAIKYRAAKYDYEILSIIAAANLISHNRAVAELQTELFDFQTAQTTSDSVLWAKIFGASLETPKPKPDQAKP